MIFQLHIRRPVRQLAVMQPGLSIALYRKRMGSINQGIRCDVKQHAVRWWSRARLSSTWPNDRHNYEAMQILQGSFRMT